MSNINDDYDSDNDIMRLEISNINENKDVFNSEWTIWYHKDKDNWFITGYDSIFTIKNITDFWTFHNNVHLFSGKEKSFNSLNIFMMRNKIKPIWEEQENRNGGVWSIKVPNKDAFTTWTTLATYLVGETCVCDNACLINGLSYTVRNNSSIIKIWNNDSKVNEINVLHPNIVKLYGYNMIYKANIAEY